MKKKNEAFIWPETSDKDRLRQNSIKYAGMEPADAMADYYGLKLKKSKKSNADSYRDVRPGDIIKLKIKSVDKKNVIFDSDSFKENIVSSVNLFQYKRFKDNIPVKPIDCKVISRDDNKIVVDPLAPLFDAWVKDKVDNIDKQYDLEKDRSIKVCNLKLAYGTNPETASRRGGFTGDVKVDNVSKFCGQDVMVKAFIPGSHIVLNIEHDFERWNDKTVKAFITNYITGGSSIMSLICSAKEYLKFQGDKKKMEIFDKYCLQNEEWEEILKTKFKGVVTGVLNKPKKKGVFVEIPELSITGMIEVPEAELFKYKPKMQIDVLLDRIDEPTYKDDVIGQIRHKPAFTIEDGILKKCNLRFVFKLAE